MTEKKDDILDVTNLTELINGTDG